MSLRTSCSRDTAHPAREAQRATAMAQLAGHDINTIIDHITAPMDRARSISSVLHGRLQRLELTDLGRRRDLGPADTEGRASRGARAGRRGWTTGLARSANRWPPPRAVAGRAARHPGPARLASAPASPSQGTRPADDRSPRMVTVHIDSRGPVRGPVRGPGRRILPAPRVPSMRWAVQSLQLAGLQLRSMPLVMRRGRLSTGGCALVLPPAGLPRRCQSSLGHEPYDACLSCPGPSSPNAMSFTGLLCEVASGHPHLLPLSLSRVRCTIRCADPVPELRVPASQPQTTPVDFQARRGR